MKKIYQTIIDPIDGDCYPACLASVLELSLDEVPHFRRLYPGPNNGMRESRLWLNEHFGISLLAIDITGPKKAMIIRPFIIGSIILVSGDSYSFPGNPHMVVGRIINDLNDYEMIHDPNPAGKGINGDPYYYYYFVLTDPARIREYANPLISSGF